MLQIDQIKEMSLQIARAMKPERIVLFGSYARNEADENSDIDLLVVARTSLAPHERYAVARRLLANYPASFDIIVKTPEEFERWRNVVNHIVYFADRYGKVIYEKGDTGICDTMARKS